MPMLVKISLLPLWEMYNVQRISCSSISLCGQETSQLFAMMSSAGATSSGAVCLQEKIEEKITANTPGMDQVLNAMTTRLTVQQKNSTMTKEEMNQILTHV
jgi:hypothetical protein